MFTAVALSVPPLKFTRAVGFDPPGAVIWLVVNVPLDKRFTAESTPAAFASNITMPLPGAVVPAPVMVAGPVPPPTFTTFTAPLLPGPGHPEWGNKPDAPLDIPAGDVQDAGTRRAATADRDPSVGGEGSAW